jgi:hypothetical protein
LTTFKPELIMKNIVLCIVISCFCITANCQASKRDSIEGAVNEYVQAVNKAANVFLNRQLSPAERLAAIAPYPFIYEARQAELFKRVVLSADETPEIRAMALNKIYQFVENDEKLLDQAIQWFSNPETPKALRAETLKLFGNLSFSSLPGILDVYPKMLEDPDLEFRAFAASKLLLNGDARTQQLLIRGLENPGVALFEPALAIELLALSPKKEFYPAAYKVLLESRDEHARLTALQTLGPYLPAREKLIAISQSPNEKEAFRESALMALYSGDRDNIVKYVAPLLQDRAAPPRLQALGIQMSIDVRKSMAYRRSKQAQRADDYDRLILSISEGKGPNQSEELQSLATRYLLLVKPNF